MAHRAVVAFRMLRPSLEGTLIQPILTALAASMPLLSESERTTLAVELARDSALRVSELVWERYFAPEGH